MKLCDFKVFSFDCYGTLIDWETGILNALQPLIVKLDVLLTQDQILETFARIEAAQESEIHAMIYSQLLGHVYEKIASEWGIHITNDEKVCFGASVPNWLPFADSTEALQYLKRYYKLVILSNVDQQSFRGSNKRLQVEFDQVYTTLDVGLCKHSPKNFEYLIDKHNVLGYTKKDILHTAESLFHNYAPANKYY